MKLSRRQFLAGASAVAITAAAPRLPQAAPEPIQGILGTYDNITFIEPMPPSPWPLQEPLLSELKESIYKALGYPDLFSHIDPLINEIRATEINLDDN